MYTIAFSPQGTLPCPNMVKGACILHEGTSCRYIYLLEEAPSPAALAAIQSAGAAFLLTAALFWRTITSENDGEAAERGVEQKKEEGPTVTGGHILDEVLSPVAQAGLETGIWTFLANSATISAFQHTPASRGAFLIRFAASSSAFDCI